MSKAKNDGPQMRTTDGGDRISVEMLRAYLIWTLSHDAVRDQADELIFDHAVHGHLHPTAAAVALRELVDEMILTATDEDWQAVFEALAAEARETIPELKQPPSPGSSRGQRLKNTLREARRWWVERF